MNSIMAHYQSPATFCEVTYDTDWFEDDRHLTPYRYSLMRNDTDSNSDTVSLTLPSYTYYEYLKSLYDCRSTPTGRTLPPTGGHISQNPGRATTWHSFGKDTSSELSRQAVRSEPTRIRPTYPFPSLHLIQQGGDSGDEYDEDFAVTDRSKKKLVWVDALNKWVPEHQLHPRPYMSFIGNAPVLEKHGKVLKEPNDVPWSAPGCSRHMHSNMAYQKDFSFSPCLYSGGGDDRSEVKTCERFETHMGKGSSLSQSSPNKQRNNDKRDAIRKRAQEMAEQRKQRKAYSTPLYTSLTERKYKARIQSCKTPATTPVTPRHPFDKAPSPREVWQSKDKEQNKKLEPAPPPVPVKKEISIRIVSPEIDDPETEVSDDSKEKGDKKVTFLEESKANKTKKDKKKKDDTDSSDISTNNDTNNNNNNNNNSNNDETHDAKVAEKNLIDSLEKQRQQQILEQKRLLKEEQKKENERMEKEHQTETEKLQKAKEMQKQLLLQKNQDNESHYENTADPLFSHKESTPLTDIADNSIKTQPQSNNVKAAPKEKEKQTTKDNKIDNSKSNNNNNHNNNISKPAKQEPVEKSNKLVKEVPGGSNYVYTKNSKNEKVVDSNAKIMEELEVEVAAVKDDLDSNVVRPTMSQGKRRKGKTDASKTQKAKPVKPDKAGKKNKKLEEKEKSVIELRRENTKEGMKSAKTISHLQQERAKKIKVEVPTLKKEPVSKEITWEKGTSHEVKKNVIKEANVKKMKEKKEKEKKDKKEEKKIIQPKQKPMLAGMGQSQKSVPNMPPGQQHKKKKGEKLPITKPSEVNATLPVQEVEEAPKPKSPHQERRRSIVEKRQIVKKERRDGRKCIKKEEEKPEKLPDFEIEVRPVESWIYGKDDFSDKKETEKGSSQASTEPLPSLEDDLTPEFIEAQVKAKEKRRKSVLANLINTENTVRKWRKPGQLDSSYNDEMRRLELAEERRKKQMEMFDRLKNRRMSIFGNTDDDGSPRFEDFEDEMLNDKTDGFLSKYCIFTKGNIEMYRHAFDAVDESNQGWLEGEDVMIALRGVNNRLTEAEEEYLYRVLELTGYKITHGADFKMFSVLAALSQRISSLDKWMKNIIGKMDFKTLEMKMFKCKTLWECNVDKDSNSISIEQLCVELRAGGVSLEHELEVRDKLSHLHSLDLLDFLTYVPLFIMIHEAVIKNPLDDTRAK